MPVLESIFTISEICSKKNIKDVIVCPGSRNAALTLAFARNNNIKTHVLSDERSAAFVGLGMALQSNLTVGLVCTSGSAALNFAPAVAEAFFQEIPMLVLTADRPPEWINQYDGQTIFQKDVFGKNIKKSFELPSDYTHNDGIWHIERIINEAIDLTQSEPKGPVHINVPIREPFYPAENESFNFDGKSRVIQLVESKKTLDSTIWAKLLEIWDGNENKLVAVGQNQIDINESLSYLQANESAVILGDVISNIHNSERAFIISHDIFLSKINQKHIPIDLLITTGKSFISKAFKQFVRNNKPKYHLHIQEHEDLIDPLQSITHKINVSPQYFFKELTDVLELRKGVNSLEEDETEFQHNWKHAQSESFKYLSKFLNSNNYGELQAIAKVIDLCPENGILHLGNSMPVRYANMVIGFFNKKMEVFANRGTSGIDGILSTAIGQAHKTIKIVTCIIGDVSFFYDRNAFWSQNLPKNLRIVLINNGGGNIFRIIDGSGSQPELEEFFVNNQNQSAKSICVDANVQYLMTNSSEELNQKIQQLYDYEHISLLEIFTDGEKDAEIFKEFKQGFVIS
jgi:2-succinyl-5-enolpyruvyl-6-hydroxy-3-cyclohexene-1-carboxylate synthase